MTKTGGGQTTREAASAKDAGRKEGRRTHAERRDVAERKLLEAAVQIVADRGTGGLTFADLGEAAGYSRGLPRHYFGRKNDLIAAVASHIADGFANRLARETPHEPGLDDLLFVVASYFEGSRQTSAGGRALQICVAEALTEPHLAEPMHQVTQRSVRRIAGLLRHAIEKGEIRRDIDPEAQAVAILGTLRGTAAMWVTDPRHVDITKLRDSYLASLRRSLAA